MMSFYKVVDRLSNEAIIDTTETNYGLTLANKEEYKNFIDIVTDCSGKLELPIDFLVSLNNSLAIWGDVYLNNLPKPKDGRFELVSLTTNTKHSKRYISIADFISVVQQLDDIGFELFQEGFYLWEKIYEDVRIKSHIDKPKRDSSFFLFDNLESCEYYITNHKGGGKVCKVELLTTKMLFKADMKLLDEILNSYTYREAEGQADKYWRGEASNNPVFEYLFQGTCRLKPI